MYNGTSAVNSVVWALLVGFFTLIVPITTTVYAQGVPQNLQRELGSMTADEARREAVRLGIDISDPESALARARELGVPEALVQQMIDAVQLEEELQGGGTREMIEVDREVPQLSGRPIFFPEMLELSNNDPLRGLQEDEEALNIADTARVRVPLRDQLSGISDVKMYLYNTARTDTIEAMVIRRILGSKYEGMWQGEFFIPENVQSGNWSLFVQATDEQGNDNIIDTEESLPILRDGEQYLAVDTIAVEEMLQHFGYDLFAARPENFEPISMGPVDEGYLVGPGDELRLIVFGAAEFQHDLLVDNEGRILVPNVGQRTVAGSRLDDLREDLRIWLARSYAGLLTEPPEVLMDLSVTRLKPVNVFVLGEVSKPGRFPLPSNSSVFNALYTVGGPLESGSLRDIRVIRRGDRSLFCRPL